MIYVIAQIIGFLAFIISLIVYHRKKKSRILGDMVISNILNLVHYLLLGAYSGCITKVMAIIRDSFIIAKGKNKKLSSYCFLALFIIAYIVCSIVTYKGILSLFPLIAAIIYIVPIWNGNEKTIKNTAFFCYFLWLGYNIFVFSIAGIVANVVSIISTFIAMINENKKEVSKYE